MPRKPRYSHPLRQIRNAAGLSQIEMGRLVNLSKSLIQKIENGQKKMISATVFRVKEAMGCDLIKDSSGVHSLAVFRDGRPYTKIHFDDHRAHLTRVEFTGLEEKHLKASMKWDGPTVLPALNSALAIVMRAAETKGVLPALLAEIEDLIREQSKPLRSFIATELAASDIGLGTEDQEFIVELLAHNPIKAGFEINMRKKTVKKESASLSAAVAATRGSAEPPKTRVGFGEPEE